MAEGGTDGEGLVLPVLPHKIACNGTSSAAFTHGLTWPGEIAKIDHHHDRVSSTTEGNNTQEVSTSYAVEVATDYEKEGLSFSQYMLAGSVAGMVEHMAMFPVDTIKTRMQMLASTGGSVHPSVLKAVQVILKQEGVAGLYRGIGAMGLGAGPAHAVYFSVYESAKEWLGGNRQGHHPLAHASAGALATVASDAVFTPMDVVKQRLQLRRSPYRGVWDCVSRILREEGFRAFYASYRTTVLMNVPFTAMHFATYEAAKKAIHGYGSSSSSSSSSSQSEDNADDEIAESLLAHVTAGSAAGALASAITTPLDVVKTRLQCQGVCGAQRFGSTSVRAAMKAIVKEEGAHALLRGIRARVMFHTPAAAICWSTYEAGKTFLQHWNRQQNNAF